MATTLLSSDSADVGVRLSTLSPKYLHTNSTSHTWPFSAIAELIDNAYDPDVNASQLWIDVKKYNKHNYCLVFTDNGAGMGPEKLHKMLSFGFCDKVAKKGQHMPVGHYGNGFKSGSMRLGRDAIVFTKNGDTKSVGFLSQTYLEAIKAETILVPMVTWDSDGKIAPKSDKEKALQDILTHSIFKYKEELLAEFAGIQNPSGTRIIIFNVRTTPDGKPEFDFSVPYDIRIPEDTDLAISKLKKQERQNHIPESDYSLRAYCAILYLRPRMQILLRGKKVRTTVITKSLSKTEVDNYRPSAAVRESNTSTLGTVNKPVKITFGFSQNKNHYGIMMYHRNRLVKPYVRVGYQLRANNSGVGVVGVIECDFLQPTHNKQDFDYTKAYRACIAALGSKLNDYWNEKKGPQRANSKEPIPEPVEVQKPPDQTWVQCDKPDCLKWRKLPYGTDPDELPEKWYCRDNPNPNMRSCNIPEEKDDETEQPYVKTQKKRLEKEMEDRKRRERDAKQRQEQEAKRLQQQQKELEKKEAELQRLKKQLADIETSNGSSILQSIEQKSAKQQQAIRQQMKGEQKSPQPLRIKMVTQPSLSGIKLVTQPSSGIKLVTQPSSGIKLVTQPSSGIKSSPGRPQAHHSTPLHNNMAVTKTPNRTQQQPSVKVVKVFSSLPPSNQAQTTGTKPLVHIVPSPQGRIEQQSSGSTDMTTPKVVSVQSLQTPGNIPQSRQVTVQNLVLSSGHKIHLQTPISQHVTSVSNNSPRYQIKSIGPVQVRTTTRLPTTPVARNQLPQQINTPLRSPAMQANYKPLESLEEVNRQATQASVVSPVSAVIPEATDATKKSPTEIRNQVTVSDRFRYIAPSPQTSVSAVAVSTPTAALTQQLVQTSTVKSTVPVPVQPIATPSQAFQVQIKQEPKPAVPVPPLQQTVPNIQISQVHSGTSAVAASTGVSVTVKSEKVDMPQVNGVKRGHGPDDDVIEQPPKQKSRIEKEVIIIDDPSPPPEEKKFEPEISHELALDGVDNDLIIKLGKLSREEQWIKLAKSAQQLRYLRDNVCKLLRVLVPEIDLGDKSEILDDTTVDNLLKQVLEANIQPPGGFNS